MKKYVANLPDVNVARDKDEILEFKTLRLEDSLLYLHPEIAKEWHPTKNGKDLFLAQVIQMDLHAVFG